ncbi:MAG: membrane protein insertion efficiency factor YidD, partial [Bacilli bacterium]|nr:membrane protein insertion efficiency factor YidD [Bacilli bacterium]
LIRAYQITPLASHKMCRFTPTCSEYMAQAIDLYGIKKGIILGVKRIAKCRPHGGCGVDPVPEERNNL